MKIKRTHVLGLVCFLAALCLLGFNLWFRYFELAPVEKSLAKERVSLETLKTDLSGFLTVDMRDLLFRLSEGIHFAGVILEARDLVVILGEDLEERSFVLDYPQFFVSLKELLAKETVIQNLSVSSSGRVSFLIQTDSYLSAARQIEVLKFGFGEGLHIFSDLDLSSVGRSGVGIEEIYSFVVQAQINPLAF